MTEAQKAMLLRQRKKRAGTIGTFWDGSPVKDTLADKAEAPESAAPENGTDSEGSSPENQAAQAVTDSPYRVSQAVQTELLLHSNAPEKPRAAESASKASAAAGSGYRETGSSKTSGGSSAERSADRSTGSHSGDAKAARQTSGKAGTGGSGATSTSRKTGTSSSPSSGGSRKSQNTSGESSGKGGNLAAFMFRQGKALAQKKAARKAAAGGESSVSAGNSGNAASSLLQQVRSAIVTGIQAIFNPLILLVPLVVILAGSCLAALLSSAFGIFISGGQEEFHEPMQEVMDELNQAYTQRIQQEQDSVTYDELEVSGTQSPWQEMLAVYAVKVSVDAEDPQEMATLDDSKKEILREIFWQMNTISSYTENFEDPASATPSEPSSPSGASGPTQVQKVRLYIVVTHKTPEEMADFYGFSPDQRQQLEDLLLPQNADLWNEVVPGGT